MSKDAERLLLLVSEQAYVNYAEGNEKVGLILEKLFEYLKTTNRTPQFQLYKRETNE